MTIAVAVTVFLVALAASGRGDDTEYESDTDFEQEGTIAPSARASAGNDENGAEEGRT
jgi:hypothetical protein